MRSPSVAPWLGAALAWAVAMTARALAPTPPEPAFRLPASLAVAPLVASPRLATAAWWSVSRAWAHQQRLPPETLAASIRGIGQADPHWRLPWVLGGLMLQTQGDSAHAEPLLRDAAARWPDDPWFPAALGVSLRDRGQVDEAREWLRQSRRAP